MNNIKQKIAQALDIPSEIALDAPKIVMIGNSELSVENYKGILEYENNVIRIKTAAHILRVEGSKLEICAITDEEIQIRGNIRSISC